jgi:hypothetical protein
MNLRSLSLQKTSDMKTLLIFKVVFVLPVLLFISYVFMAVLGCTTCLFGLGDDFYCGIYCLTGKIFLGLATVLFFFLIFPDIKAILKSGKNASSA